MSKAEEFKKQIAPFLSNYIITLQFTKADGSIRTMKCTLHPDWIETVQPAHETKKAENPDVQAVWDIPNAGWRSFRWDSIIQIMSFTPCEKER